MHRTQLYLPQTQWKSLKQEAHKSNSSISEVIRNLVSNFLTVKKISTKKTETLSQAAKRINLQFPTAGPADLAVNVDHYLYGAPKKSTPPRS